MAEQIDENTERYFKEVLGLEDRDIEEFLTRSQDTPDIQPEAILQDIVIKKRGDTNNNPRENTADPYKKDTMADNYGYLNKPGIMGFANALPGPMGMAAKMVNGAINVSNTGAVNEARQVLGMEPRSMVKGALKDAKGYVGDYTYNGTTSPVSFEASTPDGRTALTTNEARMRQQLNAGRPATKKESELTKENFTQSNPQARGLIARAFGAKPKDTPAPEARATPDTMPNYTEPTRRAQPNRTATGVAPTLSSTPNPDGTGFQRLPNVYDDPDLPSRPMASVTIDNKLSGRSELPTSDILSQVQDVVTDTIGPGATVSLKSGMEPTGRSPVGTKDRHPKGFAGDFSITDEEGNAVNINSQQMKDIATNAAGRYGLNFGAGLGYMGPETVHMDNMDLSKYIGGPQWGATGKAYEADLNQARELGVMAPSYYDVDAPTPTTRPDPTSVAPATVAQEARATGFANVGRTMGFDPNTRETMARTLAGEIDPTKTDLSSPTGIAEANGIMSTMENRAPTYGSVEAAITAPNAYSTWGTEKAAETANANYAANPQRYNSLVDNFATDVTANTGFTNYHNPTISNPGWSAKMDNVQDIGPHKFGSLPEFGKNFGQTAMSKTTQSQMSTPTRAGLGVRATGQVSMQGAAQADASKTQSGFSGMNTGSVSKGPSESSKSSTSSSGGQNRSGGMGTSTGSAGKSSTGPSQGKTSTGPSSTDSNDKDSSKSGKGGGW